MTTHRSEHAEAARASLERLCRLAGSDAPNGLVAERQELERAVAQLTTELDALAAERDDGRAAARRAELELDDLRQVLEDGPDGYLVSDGAGAIRRANRGAGALLGVPNRFLIGKPLSIFVDERDLPVFYWRLRHVDSRGRGEWPIRMRPRSGAPFTAGLTVTAFPRRQGQDVDLRWFLRDISARQRAEELEAKQEFTDQMLESEQTARADAEAARLRVELLAEVSGVLAASLDHKAALARVGGLIVPAAADLFLADLVTAGELEPVAMACSRSTDAEWLGARRPPGLGDDHPIVAAIRTGESELISDVSPSWLERWTGGSGEPNGWPQLGLTSVAIVPIRSRRHTHGALTFAYGPSCRRYEPADLQVLKDIGLRTALALDTGSLFRELESEHRRRDEFLAMLAHELRNPLAAVIGGLEALDRADAASRGHIHRILGRQSRHLARLLNDLLDVSGLRFGRVNLRRERVDLRDLAHETLDALNVVGPSAKPAITLVADPEPALVVGDADRLRQVISNLLDNAIKYTPSTGTVELRVAIEHDDAVIRVRDSGAGIPSEFLPRIFEVFSRGGGAGGQAHPGLGLGLSIVRELVLKHGGSVEVTSPGVGKGSEFVVRLPLASAHETAPSVPARGPRIERAVLIVEDNADTCEVLRIALELSGHHVRTANTGRQAIEEARARPPGVALVDIGLPDIDGYEVGRAVRAQPGGDDVYLVALTGRSAPADRDRALQAGFNSYLVKPVDPDMLLEIIARAPLGRSSTGTPLS
jgi:PAS domain S-box-containing protein